MKRAEVGDEIAPVGPGGPRADAIRRWARWPLGGVILSVSLLGFLFGLIDLDRLSAPRPA